MDASYYQLATAAGYQEARLAVLSNNLANVNTTGYKADQLRFSEVFDQTTGTTQMVADQYLDSRNGAVEKTGNALDVAISGDGYFTVQTSNGPRYTRSGGFQVSSDGLLVDSSGHAVMGNGGPIAIDPNATQITIGKTGRIFVDGQEVDALQVVKFPDNVVPVKTGNNLLSGAGAVPIEHPMLEQGFIERSNVESVVEMSRMIDTVRTYEAYQKLIQTLDQTQGQTNQVGSLV